MPVRMFLSSGDLVADRRFDFARDLQLKGDLVAAADLLLQATELAPGFASAWFTLGEIREQLGERDTAIKAFRKAQAADPEDRHGARLRLMRLGAERLVYCRLGTEQLIVRTDENRTPPAMGAPIHVTPRVDRLHWFDAASGKRI